MSSGCIRLTNPDIVDLYGRTNVGAKVVVLAATPGEEVPIDDRQGTTRRASRDHAAGRRAAARRALARQVAPPRQPAPRWEASPAVGWGPTAASAAIYGWH
jgi:hypothetical protein